jgi:hypothetical protein
VNWWRKLAPGGVIAGIIPDCRYTFDLRQPPSQAEEFVAEFRNGTFELPLGKFDRWCRYTAPYNTPEDLVARQYSVHAHYYTPEVVADLIGLLRRNISLDRYFIDTHTNNKDFGFLLSKAGNA